MTIATLASACTEDAPEVEETADVAVDAEAPFDEGTTPAMTTPPSRLLQVLPAIPEGIIGVPGTHITELLKDPLIKKDPVSSRILKKKHADGPFSHTHYFLDETGTKVVKLEARFHSAYNVRERDQVVLDYAKMKLGTGTTYDNAIHTGHRWKRTQYKIELRKDKKLGWFELVFDSRGAIDPLKTGKKRN